MNKPLPLHRLAPSAQARILRGLHQSRGNRKFYATLRIGRGLYHAFWGDGRTVPTTFYQEGQTPRGRVSPWPRVPYRGTAGSFPGGLRAEGVDHEAISWAYEKDEDWWEREEGREEL